MEDQEEAPLSRRQIAAMAERAGVMTAARKRKLEQHSLIHSRLPQAITDTFPRSARLGEGETDGKYVEQWAADVIASGSVKTTRKDAKLRAAKGIQQQASSTASPAPSAESQTQERKRAARRKALGSVKRGMKAVPLPKDARSFEQYEPLHRLWFEYITGLVAKDCTPEGVQNKLFLADWHGAMLKVVRSRSPTYVGVEGIVVQETATTFRIVTPLNRLIMVPKEPCEFECKVGQWRVTLRGSQLLQRPAERKL
eukprot:m51a1_g10802 putative ribonuclease p protein subunit p29-like (254) ;mRNA; f:29146-30303